MEQTRKLYMEDPYQTECIGKVLTVLDDPLEIKALGGMKDEDSLCLVLDQTVFFPEGGGQPSDLGRVDENWEVQYVFESSGIIYHQIRKQTQLPLPELGTHVPCHIDWERRFLSMQRHNGEHILSAAFYRLFGGVNRGFHMGNDWMTIDISLEGDQEGLLLTDDQIEAAEWEANRMVWANLPVKTRFFQTKSEAEHLPMRKQLTIEQDITLVSIGDTEDAAGCVACCGTHPQSTGEVGLIKIYKWEAYKGMTRITFDAGSRAFEIAMQDGKLVKQLAQKYSSDRVTLLSKMEHEEQKSTQTRQELYAIKQAYLAEKGAELVRLLHSSKEEGNHVFVQEYPVLKADDLTALGTRIQKDPLASLRFKLLVLISPSEQTVILASDGAIDLGKLVKENAGVWKGKGGGRQDQARALFPTRQDLDCFIDYLQKSYHG